jgi:hypothetical protein
VARLKNSHVRHELALAREAWSAGIWIEARHCAQKAMVGASEARDRHLEASASLLLAQVLTLESRFDWAQRFANRAHLLFRDLSEPVESCEALLSLSYAESALGRDEVALGAASNAVSYARHAPHLSAAGLNYVGVVSFWRREYGMARDVLDAACESAPGQGKHRSASFQPLVNAAFTELLRCADLRMQGRRADTSGLVMLVANARELEKRGATESLSQAASYAGLFLLEFESFYLAHLTGDASRADSHYLSCLKRSSRLPESSWMQGLVRWAQLERALVSTDASQVAESAMALASSYQGSEHVHMKNLARRLCAHSTRQRLR